MIPICLAELVISRVASCFNSRGSISKFKNGLFVNEMLEILDQIHLPYFLPIVLVGVTAVLGGCGNDQHREDECAGNGKLRRSFATFIKQRHHDRENKNCSIFAAADQRIPKRQQNTNHRCSNCREAWLSKSTEKADGKTRILQCLEKQQDR